MSCPDYSLYLILDPELVGGRLLMEVAEEAIAGGVTAVQLRDKRGSARQFLELARRLKELTSRFHLPLIVNDRLDIALAARAEGIHLGQEDLPAAEARAIAGSGMILGVSVSCPEEAREAERSGASYVGLGSIFPTASKTDAGRPLGTDAIAAVCRAVQIPVVAIGGIGVENVAEVIARGAAGVAVISAILQAADPRRAAQELRRSIEASRAQRGMQQGDNPQVRRS
jgi:thiamine-phosphate pyrophosphorylase